MSIPGVVGHGVGLVDGEPGIKVFLLKPGVAGVPARLDDIPTAVEVTGMFVAGSFTARDRPADNGYSIGHPDITAGTLGTVVQDGGGYCHVLSNNHVLANGNDANIGDSALQPGPFDGGTDPDDAIAALYDFEMIDFSGGSNRLDAAIAKISSPVSDFVSATTPYFTHTNNVIGNPDVGLSVKKVGRTTELTTGQITEINVTSSVCYAQRCRGPFFCTCTQSANFTGQIATSDMSEGGDSGSLLVDSSNNPVGLLFAGSATRTIYNQIDEVLARFNATVIQPAVLASCSNGGGEPTPVTDVSVSSVSAPSSAVQGDVVSVDVTVENVGNQDVTSDINVTLTDDTDGVPIGTQTISGGLAAGGSTTVAFSWNTAGASLGDHTLTASQDFTDDDATNDSGSTTVAVNEAPVPGTAPVVDACTPPGGNPNERLTVAVTGSGFQDGATADFGDRIAVQGVTFVSPSQLDVQIKVHRRAVSGPRDVTVTNPDDQSGTMAGCFTVN